MKKKAKKINLFDKKNIKALVTLIVVLVLCFVIFIIFTIYSRKAILRQLHDELENNTLVDRKYLTSQYDASLKTIKTIASLNSKESFGNMIVNAEALTAMSESAEFDHIAYASAGGKILYPDTTLKECREEAYFINGMNGQSGLEIRTDETGKTEFYFYAPFVYRGGIVGIFVGIYDSEYYDRLLSRSFSELDSFSYLCLYDGTILSTDDKKMYFSNIFDVETFTESSDLKNAIDEVCSFNDSSSFTTGYRANTYCHVVTNIPQYELLLIRTYPPEVLNKQLSSIFGIVIALEIAIVVLFLLYTWNIVLRNRKQQDALRLKNKSTTSVITAASTLFKRFAIIDIQKDTYEYFLMERDADFSSVSTSGRFSDLRSEMQTRYVNDEGVEDFYNFMNPENLNYAFSNGEKYYRFEYTVNGDSEKWERLNVIALDTQNGETKSVLLAVEDITELKLEDERKAAALKEAYNNAQAANNAKSVFLASMSHDIRTPMNAIIGMTTIARSHIDDSARVEDCLDKISLSSKHLLGLINDVLDMSKIESGRIDLSESNFDIHDLVESLQVLVRPPAEAKQQTLSLEAKDIIHEHVCGDIGRIQQIFVNLIGNSVKYTPEKGRISFTVTERPSQSTTFCTYEFTISDNGIGMSEEFVKKIFDPFTRAQDSRIKNIQGSGLGMSITRNLITMMDGSIDVDSRLNEGTTIRVTLLLKLNVSGVSEKEDDEGPLQESFPGKKILLVEDNLLNAEIATEILGMYDIAVEHVANGKLAVDKMMEVQDDYYDMILMDIQMPVMNGYEATVAIRALPGAYVQKVPIIALSANAFEEDVQKAKNAGMNAHLAKPLETKEMLKAFNKYLV